MGFKKNNTLGGRKQGSKNKVTQDIRGAFKKLIEDNISSLQSDLESLDPKDRIKIMIDLAGYIVPKMKAIEVKADIQSNNSDMIERLFAIPESEYIKTKHNDN